MFQLTQSLLPSDLHVSELVARSPFLYSPVNLVPIGGEFVFHVGEFEVQLVAQALPELLFEWLLEHRSQMVGDPFLE